MCCGTSSKRYWCIKYSIIIFNFGFQLLGCLFLVLGIYSEVMRSKFTEAEHFFLTPAVFLTSLGIVIFCFSSLGCIGALRDNFCFLHTFVAFAIVCLILETGAGVAALFFKEPAKNFVNNYVLKGLITYYDDQDLKNFVDYVQADFECCGGRYFTDWEINPYHNCSAPGPSACGVPFSCCTSQFEDDYVINSMCGYSTMTMEAFDAVNVVYVSGCIDAVIDFLWGHMDLMAGILLGIFIPQFVGIVLCILYADILKSTITPDTVCSVEMQNLRGKRQVLE